MIEGRKEEEGGQKVKERSGKGAMKMYRHASEPRMNIRNDERIIHRGEAKAQASREQNEGSNRIWRVQNEEKKRKRKNGDIESMYEKAKSATDFISNGLR